MRPKNEEDLFGDEQKKAIMNFLYKNNLIKAQSSSDTLVSCEKAFKVYSILKWCIIRDKKGLLSRSQYEKYNKLVMRYINNLIDLEWGRYGIKAIERTTEK